MRLHDGTFAAFRVIHEDNLHIYLQRGAMHAVNGTPDDGLQWRATHNAGIQSRRVTHPVAAGPGGAMGDYVPFHLGARNLFLYNLHTNRVAGYTEGQGPLMTLVVSIDAIVAAGHRAVFYDGHALDAFSACTDDTAELANFDWESIDGKQFSNDNPVRKRNKQAEMLVHNSLAWDFVRGIGVCDSSSRERVGQILAQFPDTVHKPVAIRRDWYF